MSAAHHATGFGGRRTTRSATKPRTNPKRLANELLVRILIGTLLAAIAIGVTLIGGYLFAGFVALAALAAARGRWRLRAQRPLPSMMMATWRGSFACSGL